jgi:hypothetical protein
MQAVMLARMRIVRCIPRRPWSASPCTNASADIRELFCASCDALGIAWRRMNARNISVARRDAIAALDEFVGPKS